jgi:multisubunit Na+/H+ antiporter MnhC subunit
MPEDEVPLSRFMVFQATLRDPLVLTGVVLAMALLGLVATWIPAQRAVDRSSDTAARGVNWL